jgi:RING finger and CHY zinc finger domain-containing protein 1
LGFLKLAAASMADAAAEAAVPMAIDPTPSSVPAPTVVSAPDRRNYVELQAPASTKPSLPQSPPPTADVTAPASADSIELAKETDSARVRISAEPSIATETQSEQGGLPEGTIQSPMANSASHAQENERREKYNQDLDLELQQQQLLVLIGDEAPGTTVQEAQSVKPGQPDAQLQSGTQEQSPPRGQPVPHTYPQVQQVQHTQPSLDVPILPRDHSLPVSVASNPIVGLTSFPVFSPKLPATATPGCPHYSRHCHLRAPCCNALVACRRCHDALVPDGHPLDRRAVRSVKCLACDAPDQPLAAQCAFCSTRFAAYFCLPCAMYDDNPNRSIFHCDGCGVCRVGTRSDYIHCASCCACIPAAAHPKHRCTMDILKGPCLLCKMDMHESVRPVTIMRCGHAMHVGCFEKHAATSFACPKCRRSMGDMKPYWDVLDRLLETELASVTDLVSITCRDCGRDSEATIHPQYHKCDHAKCGSYNTISREFPSGGVASSAGQQKDP